jgi:hypothetical protein
MKRTPKSVIHINFVPTDLAFDARAIWTAMRDAEKEGRLNPGSFEAVSSQLGNTAIHLATRDYITLASLRVPASFSNRNDGLKADLGTTHPVCISDVCNVRRTTSRWLYRYAGY